mmetsp:Transcript_20886/g.30059  ORF Transcript_20886/g.30059 Transcript_20886/m.30059 type:complete len:523 (+) Transcript_20886:29-1597(+)
MCALFIETPLPDTDLSSEEPLRCSFAVTGQRLVHQGIYRCLTCSRASHAMDEDTDNADAIDTNCCCCAGCADTCHEGHDVEFLANGLAYCDCGSGGCELLSTTKERGDYCSALYEGVSMHVIDRIRPFNTHDFIHCTDSSDALHATMLQLANDCCETVRSSKETFWVGADWRPEDCRCRLEEMALLVFKHHVTELRERVPDITFDIASSGAEWWIQVKDLSERKEPESVKSGPAIDVHYDKDEDVAEKFSVGLFPVISTVTYLAVPDSVAQPTVIFQHTANDPVGQPIKDFYISYPRESKHISFDGRLLHGAPHNVNLNNWWQNGGMSHTSCDDATDETDKALRITFLVNVWLNHHPSGIQPLSSEIACNLCSRPATPLSTELTIRNSINLTTVNVCHDGTSATEMSENMSGSVDAVVHALEQCNMSEHSLNQQVSHVALEVCLPFVTADSTWGIEEDDDALIVRMYLPEPVSSTSDSYHLHCLDDECAARVEYIDDEEGSQTGADDSSSGSCTPGGSNGDS